MIAGELEVANQAAKGRELRSYQYPRIDFVSEYDQPLRSADDHHLVHTIELRVPIFDGLRSSSEYRASIQKSYVAEKQLIALEA